MSEVSLAYLQSSQTNFALSSSVVFPSFILFAKPEIIFRNSLSVISKLPFPLVRETYWETAG